MVFDEKEYRVVEKLPNSFIYFLISDNTVKNEVVYVGQTKNGLLRPLSHKDKEYNRIFVIRCKQSDLNEMETFYIRKYNPKYNRNEGRGYITFLTARNKLRKALNDNSITIRDIKEAVDYLAIKPEIVNNNVCINAKRLKDIYQAFGGCENGRF